MSEMKIIKTGESCPCGLALPWHIHVIADDRFTHICLCERYYEWAPEGFVLRGTKPNPFAKFDRLREK